MLDYDWQDGMAEARPQEAKRRHIRTLLAEDSYMTRKLIMRALERTGLADFEFVEARDGVEALELFDPNKIDLILIDIHMPRMNGLEFLQTVHAKYTQCPPAVVLTADTSRERMMAVVNEAGAAALLLKPLDADRLRTGLKKLIESIPDRTGPWTVAHADCAVQAMQEVIDQACGVELHPSNDTDADYGRRLVIGMVSLYGEVHWTLVLTFEECAAIEVATRLAGVPIDYESPDLGDAIGELTHMVAGHIKRTLINREINVQMALPTVISATEIRWLVQPTRKIGLDQVHFDSSIGRMRIGVTVGMGPDLFL